MVIFSTTNKLILKTELRTQRWHFANYPKFEQYYMINKPFQLAVFVATCYALKR